MSKNTTDWSTASKNTSDWSPSSKNMTNWSKGAFDDATKTQLDSTTVQLNSATVTLLGFTAGISFEGNKNNTDWTNI